MVQLIKYFSKMHITFYLICGFCEVHVLLADEINHISEGRLGGSVFDSYQGVGPTMCEKLCMERKTCQSYNYNVQTFTCELNTVKKGIFFDANYVPDPASLYNEKDRINVSMCMLYVVLCMYIWEKRKGSDSVVWQKPIYMYHQKCQKGKVTTQTTPQKALCADVFTEPLFMSCLQTPNYANACFALHIL